MTIVYGSGDIEKIVYKSGWQTPFETVLTVFNTSIIVRGAKHCLREGTHPEKRKASRTSLCDIILSIGPSRRAH